MSQYIIEESTLTAIANAIRNKKDTSSPIEVANFASEIASISVGAFAKGSITLTSGGSEPITIEHGLGVIPNCILYYTNSKMSGSTAYLKAGWMFREFLDYASANNVELNTLYNNEFRGGNIGIVTISNVDEDFFDISPASHEFIPNSTYYWFALYIEK